jgi:CubicO group peptidase (beta-lactamase class C family)
MDEEWKQRNRPFAFHIKTIIRRFKMRKPIIFLAGLLVMVFSLTSIQLPGMTGTVVQAATTDTPQGYEATIEAVREAVAEQLSTGMPSSATVAVMVDGEIVYAEGFGLRDRAKNLPVETDTQFNIGSISKIFTVAAVLILEQEGKLSLDRPVTDYLPEFTMKDARYKDITVRMLLNHTSGLPGSYFKDGFTAVKNRNYVEEALEALKTCNLMNDPGKISVYCNDGFTVAEAVIERVSGMSFPDFLEQKIFSKLSLENTSAYFKDGNQNIARVYEGDSIVPLPLEYVNILGSGGLSSTAIDLCKYGEILQTDTVLNKAMIEEYTKAQNGPETVPVGEPIFNAGLGWDYVQVYKFKKQGVDVLAKSGGTLQYNSELYVLPKEHISVAVIFAGPANPATVADAILQALLEEKGIVEKPSDTLLPPDAIVPDSLRDYEGFYNSEKGMIKAEITSDKSGLILSTYNGKGFVPISILTYKENGRFYGPDGANSAFQEHGKWKVMMTYLDSSDTGHVKYERLSSLDDIDASAFSGKVWVPRNLSPYDFYAIMFRTGTIPEIPGYIFINDGQTYTPLALKSPTDTWMSFNYMRDQFEVVLQDIEGETWLYTYYGYNFSDASELPVIAEGDILQIDSDGQNRAGKMGFSGLVSFSIPEGGRIVVFSPERTLTYDSLWADSPVTDAEEGSYIVAAGKPGDTFKINNYEQPTDPGGSGGSSSGDSDRRKKPEETGFNILVNGKTETAATVTTTREGDKTVTTVVIDDHKIDEVLAQEGNKSVVTIPVTSGADVVTGTLNGQTVKNMASEDAVLEIKTGQVTYTLPAAQINIDAVLEQIGKQLKDIAVSVKISGPAAETVKTVEDTANKNNYQIIAGPIEFEITCSYGSKTVEVSKFNAYVERLIALPEGVNPSGITTGVVLNPDGTFSHVPTAATMIDGKYYAKINSLTSSTYTVIYSPKTFKDVENHWAQKDINDMASRLIISGVGVELFEPERSITRAEFAAVMVRALGLGPEEYKNNYADVKAGEWYSKYISTAAHYGLVSGYDDGTFKPEEKITRQEAMAILTRAMGVTRLGEELEVEARDILAAFSDDGDVSGWAEDSVAKCVKTGIVTGKDNGRIAPLDNITRAEAASMARRLLINSDLI